MSPKVVGWVRLIGDYIAAENRNSFYLWAVNQDLSKDYRTGFNGPAVRDGIRSLLTRVVAKSQLKMANPNLKTVKSIEDQIRKTYDKPEDKKA
jgi:hypothetical protein